MNNLNRLLDIDHLSTEQMATVSFYLENLVSAGINENLAKSAENLCLGKYSLSIGANYDLVEIKKVLALSILYFENLLPSGNILKTMKIFLDNPKCFIDEAILTRYQGLLSQPCNVVYNHLVYLRGEL